MEINGVEEEKAAERGGGLRGPKHMMGGDNCQHQEAGVEVNPQFEVMPRN